MMEPNALVSVVVTTLNSGETLEDCLDSVRKQTYAPIEVIVVDNHSTDATWEIAERLADVALQGGPERSAQRNQGVAAARGDYVLWLDADMEARQDVVDRAVAAAVGSDAEGVIIAPVTAGEGFWSRCRAVERACLAGEIWSESPRFVRRDYLVRTGGFAEWLSGTEDSELRARMLRDGCRLARADSEIVYQEGRLSLLGLLRRSYYYGTSGLWRYPRAYPGAVSSQARAVVRALYRNRRRLALQPALAAGIVIMRVVEVAGYVAGAGVGWMGSKRGREAVRRSLPRSPHMRASGPKRGR